MASESAQSVPIQVSRVGFDPVPELLALLERPGLEQVTFLEGLPAWLVTRHEDVRAVLSDAATFSNNSSEVVDRAMPADRPPPPPMINHDPPEHTRFRRMLTREFTTARMRRLEPRIRAIVTDHLDAMQRAGSPADLVTDFALPVPSLVICELLGVPYEGRAEFQGYNRILVDLTRPMAERIAISAKLRQFVAGIVREQRDKPGDDLIGMMIREESHISNDELVALADLLLVAGHETTANMLSLGTLLLLRHPDQAALLREDDTIVDGAVEELTRYLSIVHNGIARIAVRDVVLAGQQIAAGDLVLCSFPAANRDEAIGDDLNKLDITRKPVPHVGFGHGIHYCLGAPLARLEMRIAFPALLRRFPTLRSLLPLEKIRFRSYSFVYGVDSLPVAW